MQARSQNMRIDRKYKYILRLHILNSENSEVFQFQFQFKLSSVWIAPHATNVDLIEIPGVEGSHANDVAFCAFIGEADRIGVDVQLFASPVSLSGKGADEVDLRFAINCTRSLVQHR